jgi:2,3-bisphosphoglycerate-independent phosphoglycerate mutase
MKYAIIIPDGAPEAPQDALDGRTSLEAADVPVLDSLAARGRLGTAPVIDEEEFAAESAAHLDIFGYAPNRYSAGEGALAAHARGIAFGTEDQVLCCNLVTVIDGQMRDFTAGFIPPAEAQPLVEMLNETFGEDGFRFQVCEGYRNLCIWENAGADRELRTMPPERVVNSPIRRHMPAGSDSRPLYDLMLRAEALLREHDINLVRKDLGESPATAIWLWGHGPRPNLPAFEARYGVRGGLIAGSDVVRGIGSLIGWERLEVGGSTDLPSVEYEAIGIATVRALDGLDLVCVQMPAPHTLGTLGQVQGKLDALKAIDHEVVRPLMQRLEREAEWRVLVMPARAGGTVQHPGLGGRTMFVMAGTGIASNRGERFDEGSAVDGELHPDRASDLMEYFLRR